MIGSHSNKKLIFELQHEINDRLSRPTCNSTAEIRAVRREFSKRLAKAPPQLIVQLALALLRSATKTPRFFAYELILHNKEALKSLNANSLEELGKGISGWGEVDAFASYLSGPVWREHQVSDGLIKRWAQSPDQWWRRAAVVSTVPLNNQARGGSGDTPRTLSICSLVVCDRDEMVVKALSWALRELAKKDAKAVRVFLRSHEDSLAPRVKREVNNKLSSGLKNPRKVI
jgi:3-methyladenine DNA glycosylase AlkD